MDLRTQESKNFILQHEEVFGRSELSFSKDERDTLSSLPSPQASRLAGLLERLDECVGVNTYYHRSNYTRNNYLVSTRRVK